jgi:hypothetical protein
MKLRFTPYFDINNWYIGFYWRQGTECEYRRGYRGRPKLMVYRGPAIYIQILCFTFIITIMKEIKK